MAQEAHANATEQRGAFAPLRERVFRNIWTASLFTNFSQMFLSVGAAWEMTKLSNSPTMVALVQTAMMLPLMLVTLPAGAIADMFDRRKIAMSGLAFSAVSAAALALVAFFGMTTPWMLLGFCLLIGAGVALFSPSWQASIPEQVSREHLPAAIALGTISFNVARSFGPALGGVIVLAAGAEAVFALTCVLYTPLLIAFGLWKRQQVPSRLPPERIDRAIVGGVRYARHSPLIRTALVRSFFFGLATATAMGLAPLVAKDLLQGDAVTFGTMLGAQGAGAVAGALFVGRVRERIGVELAIRLLAIGSGLSLIGIGFSHSLVMTCAAFAVIGACNMLTIALLNVTVQMSAPRWVTARALSLFSSAITAGLGVGAWAWGQFAASQGLSIAFVASGVAAICTVGLGFLLPLGLEADTDTSTVGIRHDPDVGMDLRLRSGPVVIEIEYEVDGNHAREFYEVMGQIRHVRMRLSGFDWSISRDIQNPNLWIERYHCPTWGDYLRMRDRYSQSDMELQARAGTFNETGKALRVRRMLERPFGSVRWKADSPDPLQDTISYIAP